MRKKFSVVLLLCLVLGMSFGLCAHAAAPALDYVTDAALILSEQERLALNDQAAEVSKYYDCGVYVCIVDDYRDYVNGSMQDFSEAVYTSYSLGEGEGRDGILLALSMAERDYDLCAYGDFANYAFTDYGKEKLSEEFLDDFRNNDWVDGFNDYIAGSISLIDLAKQGNPLDTIVYDEVPEEPGIDGFELLLIVLIPSVVALAVCAIFAAQMKTAKAQTQAMDYVNQQESRLRVKSDQFLTRRVTRQIIKRDNDGPRAGGGRPGGTSINLGGFSHRGGKF